MEAGHFSGATCPSAAAAPTLGKTATAYDAEYTTVTDPAGKTRRSRLDGLGRLVRVDEPTGSPPALGAVGSPNQGTSYTYNALDNLTRVTQGAQTRTFAYDSLSRLTSAANPESGTIAYTYDNNGNLTQRTDARGVVTAYTYDRLDRLTRRSYSYTGSETAVSLETTQVDYAYDGCGSYSRGRLCSVTAKKGTTQVSRTAYNRYDALGRVLESTQTTEGQAYTMAYAYDRAGNLIRQRYPSERVVDYVYDGAGRIAGVKTGIDDWYAGGTGSNAVDYEPHGGVKQLLLGNGLWEQRRYNARLQPTRIGLGTTKTTGGLTATGTRPTASLLLLDYSYGAGSNNGNVLSQRIRVGASLNQNQAYTYDALNRLKTAAESGSGAAWSQTYAYDRYGNRRVTAGASHGSNQALTPQSTADIAAGTNRLAGTKGVNLTVAYDGAGNLKADWAANAFKYDGDNRLVAFDKAMGTDSDTTYVYNVGGQLLAEFGGTAPDRPGTRYLTPDHLGSTRVVTGEDQSVLSRHDYLPFGEEIGAGLGGRSSVSGYTASLADGPTQKFTGKERDAESQLDYFGARYFSGAGGRFTSADAPFADQGAADPQSWNLYSYTRNNPLKYVDPDGRGLSRWLLPLIGTPAGQQALVRGAQRYGRIVKSYGSRAYNAATRFFNSQFGQEATQTVVETTAKAATDSGATGSPGPLRIHEGQQGKHIKDHNNYVPEAGRSVLTHKDPQALVDEFAGTGHPEGQAPVGQAGSKESVDFGEVIGEYRDEGSNDFLPTTRGTIHYAKDGMVHIVPAKPPELLPNQ